MGKLPGCHCRIKSWPALRHALGLTQADFATLLSVHRDTIAKNERMDRHRCPMRAVVQNLRLVLLHEECQARLKAAGIAYPYPEDLEGE